MDICLYNGTILTHIRIIVNDIRILVYTHKQNPLLKLCKSEREVYFLRMKEKKTRLYIKIGNKVREARKCRGMTQEKLAESCDVSWSAISRLENGASAVGVEKLVKIAEVLDVGLDFLLSDFIRNNYCIDDSDINEIIALLSICDKAVKEYAVENLKFWEKGK